MELRRVEDEVKSHCKSWRDLCRPSGGACNGYSMPTLKELFSKLNDEDIFPPEPEEEPEDVEDDIQMKEDEKMVKEEKTDKEECLDSDKNSTENSISANSVPVSKPALSASESIAFSDSIFIGYIGPEGEEEGMTDHEMTPQQILERLENIKASLTALAPKINKFLKRLAEKDPITRKPRYGEKAMIRVKHAVRAYKALEIGISGTFQDHTKPESAEQSSLVSNLQKQIQMQEEQMNEQRQAKQTQEQIELERIANEKLLAEKRETEQRLLEDQRKREAELELSRRAEEARRRRIEEEQLALAAEREADANLLSLVPTKGPEGVREQIERMRQALKGDRAALDVALGSLYTLFDQISRKPEEVSFRRVRRDHPKFNEDIGRHVGGKEVLIAAGFRLETLDGIKCFFSREPNIEHDMNGWSDWFDGLKKTLEVIEEEMIK
mmetsp:Transcript_11474/g.17631  ORF Transcript_11474/g.17631 Transcript_11474/m.17631 type:complete len:439 (-) Transcript_11474:1323-2639(-)